MNIEEILNEAFEDYWPGDEPWKKEEHYEVYKNGFAAGIANLLACQNPAITALRDEIDRMMEIERKNNG